MKATRVRGELGPACAKCQTVKTWSGTRWLCRPCNAQANRFRRTQLAAVDRDAERIRANELRNARRAAWTPEQREREYERIREWRVRERASYLAGSRRWYAENTKQVLADKAIRYREDPAAFVARNMLRKKRTRDAGCDHGRQCVDADFLREVYMQPCYYCGGIAEDADHFYPLSGGGLHCRENIVPACGPCNGSKYNHDPIEWMASRVS